MGWSTREVAHLAGTTLRAVRHYHEAGLLDEPERMPNGYKSYRTEHLVRLLEIRRLTRLGLPLATIAKMTPGSSELDSTLEAVEADLAAKIAQLQQARAEISRLRRRPAETDLPFEVSIAASAAEISAADRSLFAVVAEAAGAQGSAHWSALLQGFRRTAASDEFDSLAADADEQTRRRLAEALTPPLVALLAAHPAPPEVVPARAREQTAYGHAVIDAMLDLYNPAQLDVVARIWRAAGVV